MTEAKELVKCLRCISTVGSDECEQCKYVKREKVVPGIPVKPDVVIDGVGYWENIDCDQICLDAAIAIEMLLGD